MHSVRIWGKNTFAANRPTILGISVISMIAIMYLVSGCGSATAAAAKPQTITTVNLAIVPQAPGAQSGWVSYLPQLNFSVPANTVITVNIENYDLGGAPLTKSWPYTTVTGVINKTATENGHPISSLPITEIAHTFTIPKLNVNVPITLNPDSGQTYATVSFQFNSGAPGTYLVRCFVPCGTGSTGWDGPMATNGMMMGQITVVG